ncbi:hypothetical protein AB0I28_15875 [Phytomonospora sp. NPDC050363]|uniref:hypothetical protein n=1 Tax=Phytomonospora sp. NPDC050363 TaxID=3155642 RepID=UPI0033F69564
MSTNADLAHQLIVTLCHRYAFGDVRALLPGFELPAPKLARMRRLCLFGQRLADLDAEDFDMDGLEGAQPDLVSLVERAKRCRMPQEPGEADRGALKTMRPAFRLLLEVLEARWRRADMAGLVSCAHIMSEYLPLLVWESVWGHAADPALLPATVDVMGSRFGDRQAQEERRCDHNRTDAGATQRALKVASGPGEGWRAYLDRQHSNVSHALAVCASRCRNRCGVVNSLDKPVRDSLEDRCSVALSFGDSALIRLRHAAPVGHGFGVPSREEVSEVWARSREALAKRGEIGAAVATDDGFCLPGLPSLFTALAGVELVPDTLLRDVADLAVRTLSEA